MNKIALSVIIILIIGTGMWAYLSYPTAPVSINNGQGKLSMSSSPRDSVGTANPPVQPVGTSSPKGEYIDCSRAPAANDKKLCGKYIQDTKQLPKNMEEWAHSVDRSNSGTISSGMVQ